MGGWVGSSQITKSLPNQDNSILDILEIFWTFLLEPPQPFTGFYSVFYGPSEIRRVAIVCYAWISHNM